MQITIDKVAEWFLSTFSKEDDIEGYTRARMVVSGIVVSWMVIIPVLIILECLFIGYPQTQWFTLIVTLSGVSTWAIALFILRLFNNFTLCIHILVGSGIAIVSVAIFYTNGIHSPVVIAIVVPPVLAAIFTEKRYALFWCCVCSLVCIGFYLVEASGLQFPNLIPVNVEGLVTVTFSVLACFLVVGMLYIYEEINHQFQTLLEGEKQKFSTLANHDDLTGLANRLQFNNNFDKALNKNQGSDNYVGLIYIDLDDFKPINDNYGHEAGDQVLKIASQRMSQCVRLSDTVARLGGDEFAIILDGVDHLPRIETIANKLEHILCQPMEIGQDILRIGASIGISISNNERIDANLLIQQADEDMYARKQAKKHKRSQQTA